MDLVGLVAYCFFLIFTVAFLLFLVPSGGSNPVGQSFTLASPNPATKSNLSKAIITVKMQRNPIHHQTDEVQNFMGKGNKDGKKG